MKKRKQPKATTKAGRVKSKPDPRIASLRVEIKQLKAALDDRDRRIHGLQLDIGPAKETAYWCRRDLKQHIVQLAQARAELELERKNHDALKATKLRWVPGVNYGRDDTTAPKLGEVRWKLGVNYGSAKKPEARPNWLARLLLKIRAKIRRGGSRPG